MYPYQVNQQSLIHLYVLFNGIITALTRVQAEQPTLQPATNRKCMPITIIYGLKHARRPYYRSAHQS